MKAAQDLGSPSTDQKTYRMDSEVQDGLRVSQERRRGLGPRSEPLNLPEAVFPLRPELKVNRMTEGEYRRLNGWRGWKAWGVPYFKSRWYAGQLRPIVAYLFTEYKCNLDCHYCWAYNNKIKGMTEDTARRSIDWLEEIGCRVLALMGGEPLLRWPFVHKVTQYAAKKGFFVYLATNGRLLRPKVIDRLGDSGIAVFNLAVDSVEERPELPKAIKPIWENFEYLVEMQRYYGYTAFLNINITAINLEDVKELTEIARTYRIATDYHINESPMMEQSDFKHQRGNTTFILREHWEQVDALIDWILERHGAGYLMANPREQIANMKNMMRGHVEPWRCRAGQNTLIIREDGTLAPCFPMYGATHDWGLTESPDFDLVQLDEMKTECNRHCFSTLNSIVGHCYDDRVVVKWLGKQVKNRFRGVTGSM
ncbi:MAG: radical SAM protein [Acidobacteriota bacterium]|nr:MAG: radical SAM protein [Acidobacteriota bacterium]